MIDLGSSRLDLRIWGDGPPQLVMLHDGLGSVEQWGSVPATVAERTGLTVAAYDRGGHGRSTPVPSGPWPADWLHHEADELQRILDHLDCLQPLIVGHSDGGSIALIHAAEYGGHGATLTLAAHTWVESVCFDAIMAMRAARKRIEAGLGRYHQHPNALFEAWSGVWTSDDFQQWDVRPLIAAIDTPVWIAQGTEDEYATSSHHDLSAEAIGPNAMPLSLERGRHLLHHQNPQMVIDLIARFVGEVGTPQRNTEG